MRKRCSIQQGEKNGCWSEQSPEKLTVSIVPFLGGHPVYWSGIQLKMHIKTGKSNLVIEFMMFDMNEYNDNFSVGGIIKIICMILQIVHVPSE